MVETTTCAIVGGGPAGMVLGLLLVRAGVEVTMLGPLLRGADPTPPAALFGLVERLPWLSVVPAYFIGVGVRPEHAPAFARR